MPDPHDGSARRLGLSSFVLASPFGDGDVATFPAVRQLGYDLVEICIEDVARLTPAHVKDAADRAGLALSIGGAFGPAQDISHESESGRRAGLDYLLDCIGFAAAVGARVVSGPMYSAAGKARMLPPAERARQRGWAVDGLRIAADFGQENGVSLAIEPLNRFETDLVNTVEQGIELCRLIDRANVGLVLDTFHMNIEEKDIPGAIRAAGPRVKSFQASENDRGICGSGHLPWNDIFITLEEVDYRGPIIVESFRPDIAEIAASVSLWRPVAHTMEDLASESIRFLRAESRLAAAASERR